MKTKKNQTQGNRLSYLTKRSVFIFILTCLVFGHSYAQDYIIKKTGEKVLCKITSVDSVKIMLDIDKDGKTISTFILRKDVEDYKYGNTVPTQEKPVVVEKYVENFNYGSNVNPNIPAKTEADFRKFSRFIRQNNFKKLSDMIKSGKNINARDNRGVTPLLYSLQLDKVNFAEMFINAGANINLYDINYNGCLHYAIQYCTNTDIINKLIDKGADINHPNSLMYTPFHFALLFKCPEVPLYLIKKGADYKMTNSYGESGIHLSVKSGCDSIFNFLLKHGLNYNLADNDGNTPILVALQNNKRWMTEKLMNLGADIIIENSTHYTPIFYAIQNDDTLNFNKLINKGAKVDIEAEGVPPIYLAASKENRYFVEKLLTNGAQNPMKCDVHDICFQTAFIYSVSASLANEKDKLGLYQNSLNIYNLAKEKYKNELNKIRAKNTAKACGEVCLIAGGAAAGAYVVPTNVDYQAERINYLKSRIENCNRKINELQSIISSSNHK